MKVFLLITLLAMCVVARAQEADATARYLAGLPVRGTALEALGSDPAWADHATDFDAAWSKLEARQLSRIRSWASNFLGTSFTDRGTMFYMFSGPDFLYAHAFFPHADTYILCGTEAVGTIPDVRSMPRAALHASLANLRKSLSSVLSWSFFITKDMKVDLTQTQLGGTLPVIMVFLARAGCRIAAVEPVGLDRGGQVTAGGGGIPGVRIRFFGSSGQSQTVYYFTTDLSNWGIKSNPGFLRFCEQQERGASLLKAASYLMHENGFSDVREFLLRRSSLLVQDDSGIPLRFFAPAQWTLRYFGHYTGPIELFKQYPQPDLARAHATTHPPPLEFGFGYQWQPNRSALVIAKPK